MEQRAVRLFVILLLITVMEFTPVARAEEGEGTADEDVEEVAEEEEEVV